MPTAMDHTASPKERLQRHERPISPRELTGNTHPHLPDSYLRAQMRQSGDFDDVPHEDADDLRVALERMAEIERDGAIPFDEFKKALGL